MMSPHAPISHNMQQEHDLMEALERAQAAGDEQALRQILEQLNARAASAAAGQPEPQPEAEPTLHVAEPAAQPEADPTSQVAEPAASVEASSSASVAAASEEAENAAIAAATQAALQYAADARAEAKSARQRGRGTLVGKRSKQEKTRMKETAKPPTSPSKGSTALQERADAAALAIAAGDKRPRYKTLASGVIRTGVELDSEKVGKLVVGEVFVALATQLAGDTARVKCDRGWVSVLAKSGKEILQLLDADDATASSPPASRSSSSDSDSESDWDGIVAAAAEAEKWRGVVRGSEFVCTELPREELARRRQWVLSVPLFSGLDDSLADAVARVFDPQKVERKTIVIEKGAVAEQEMYFVAKGEVEVLTSLENPPFATLGVGHFVCEGSLLDSTPRNTFVFARKAALLYVLRKSDLQPILRKSPEAEAQMTTALQEYMSERTEQREAMEFLFQGRRLWRALVDASDEENETQTSAGLRPTEDKPADTASRSASVGATDALPQQQNGQVQQSAPTAASQDKSQKPPKKQASSTDSPVKRSVALLKAAGAEDKLIKAGDNSRVSEALRLYTEALEVLEEALASDSTGAKVKETLAKKEKGVRKRIELLAEAQHAVASAAAWAEKAQKELGSLIKAASTDEQHALAEVHAAKHAATDSAAGPKTGTQLNSTLDLSSEPVKPADVAENGKDLLTEGHTSVHAELARASRPLGLPPAEAAPRPHEDAVLQTDAAAFFANLQAGTSSKSAPQPDSGSQLEPEMKLESQPETDSVGLNIGIDRATPTVDASDTADGGPLALLTASAGLEECENDAAAGAGAPRTQRTPELSPRSRTPQPSLILQLEEGLPTAAAAKPGPKRSTASAQMASTVAPEDSLTATNSTPTDTVSAAAGSIHPPATASHDQRRNWKAQFHAGQAIEVMSESLGGWQEATVTGVTREMIRVEYAGRHRYIDLQEDGSVDPVLWRFPTPTPSSTCNRLVSARVSRFSSSDSPKTSSLRSPMSSTDWESTPLRPSTGMPRPLSFAAPNSSATSPTEVESPPWAQRSPSSDIYVLERLVSSQFRGLVGAGLHGEGEEKILHDLGHALAVLDRTVQAVSAQATPD